MCKMMAILLSPSFVWTYPGSFFGITHLFLIIVVGHDAMPFQLLVGDTECDPFGF